MGHIVSRHYFNETLTCSHSHYLLFSESEQYSKFVSLMPANGWHKAENSYTSDLEQELLLYNDSFFFCEG